jgi:hypothetical protein
MTIPYLLSNKTNVALQSMARCQLMTRQNEKGKKRSILKLKKTIWRHLAFLAFSAFSELLVLSELAALSELSALSELLVLSDTRCSQRSQSYQCSGVLGGNV